MTHYQELLQLLHRGKSPYEGYPAAQWDGTWYGDPGARRQILLRNLDRAQPGVVLEVGSFVGESAIFMAQHLKATQPDSVVLCIDTWYGGIDHYKGAPEKINMHFGRPDFYYRFMANVMQHGCQDMILPLALDSINAARLLSELKVQADLIYVDASHEAGDVLRDYQAYWPLVRPGGVMIVDDVSNHFPGVVEDWTRFAEMHELRAGSWDVQGEKIAVVKA